MLIASFTLDTQVINPDDLRQVLYEGQVLHAVGIINTHWEEYSALETAQQSGLQGVAWDYTEDDMPGTLDLTVWYPTLNKMQANELLAHLRGIESIEIFEGSLQEGKGGMPFNSK